MGRSHVLATIYITKHHPPSPIGGHKAVSEAGFTLGKILTDSTWEGGPGPQGT
jgi:hypothetical protein